jgi:hypothetical protein
MSRGWEFNNKIMQPHRNITHCVDFSSEKENMKQQQYTHTIQ